MSTLRTIFTVQFKTIGKPAGLESVNVAAANMEDALDIVRNTHGHPRITMIYTKDESVLVRS